jgi:hypothetical protein
MQDQPNEQRLRYRPGDCPDTEPGKGTLVRWQLVSLGARQGSRGIVVPSYFTPGQIAEAVRREDEEREGRSDR